MNQPQSHVDILPPSIAGSPIVQNLARLLDRWDQLDVRAGFVYDIDRLPAAALPLIAEQFSAEEFIQPNLSESQLRELLKTAIVLHRIKGTPAAIRLLLQIHGIPSVDLIEWWQTNPPGPVHTFRVAFDGTLVSASVDQRSREYWDRLIHLITVAKPVRSSFSIATQAPVKTTGNLAATTRTSAIIRARAGLPPMGTGVAIAATTRTSAIVRSRAGLPPIRGGFAIAATVRITAIVYLSLP